MKPNKFLLVALFCSGAAALIYQIAWMRPIGLVYHSTIYLVSIVTAAFMLGLAIGGYFMRLDGLVDKLRKPILTYAVIEAGIALYGIILLELFRLLPEFNSKLLLIHDPSKYHWALFISIIALLIIPTTLMGATFPIAICAWFKHSPARRVGEVYAINNFGAICGALLAGFVLLPTLGVRGTVVTAGVLNMAAAAMMMFSEYRLQYWKRSIAVLGLFVLLAGLSKYSVERLYRGGFLGLSGSDEIAGREILFEREGRMSTVVVFQSNEHGAMVNRLVIDGQGSSSLRISDVRVSVLLGFLPRWLRPELDSAAVIGFGVGGASRTLANGVHTTSIEIEPEVVSAAPYFEKLNSGVLDDSNHRLVFDDARNFLLRSKERYGIIVNHPMDPNRTFSSLLFTKEFYEIVASKLEPGGVYVQWIPLYYMSRSDFENTYHTLNSVFPHQVAFTNGFYLGELIVVSSKEEIPLEPADLKMRLDQVSPADRRLLELGEFSSFESLMTLAIFTEDQMTKYDQRGDLLTDDNPKLEFSLATSMIRNDLERSNGDSRIQSEMRAIRESLQERIRPNAQ